MPSRLLFAPTVFTSSQWRRRARRCATARAAPSRAVTTTSTRPSLSRSPNAAPRCTALRAKRRPPPALPSAKRPSFRLTKTALAMRHALAEGALRVHDVGAGHEQVLPAVVVEVDDAVAPARPRRARRRPTPERVVTSSNIAPPQVLEEREASRSRARSGRRRAGRRCRRRARRRPCPRPASARSVKATARSKARLREGAVAVVHEQAARAPCRWRRRGRASRRRRSRRRRCPCPCRRGRGCPAAAETSVNVPSPLLWKSEFGRPWYSLRVAVVGRGGVAADRLRLGVPHAVVRDEEVEPAVAVVVDEGGGHRPQRAVLGVALREARASR